MNIKRIGLLTSGGDSPGMNAAIRAVFKTCSAYDLECFGIRRGYQGLIENEIFEMQAMDFVLYCEAAIKNIRQGGSKNA